MLQLSAVLTWGYGTRQFCFVFKTSNPLASFASVACQLTGYLTTGSALVSDAATQTRTKSLFKCVLGVREDWGLG